MNALPPLPKPQAAKRKRGPKPKPQGDIMIIWPREKNAKIVWETTCENTKKQKCKLI